MIPVLFLLWLAPSFLLFFSLFRVLRFRFAHRQEEVFFAAVAALGWMSFCAVVLGLFGVARLPAFAGAALSTAAAAVALLLRALRAGISPPSVPRPAIYALSASVLLLAPLVLIPPFFFDTLRYHYALPAIYLRTGSTWPLPHFVESNLPLGVEMLSMIGMTDASHAGANLVNLLLFALCGFGILCLADRLGSRRAGWIGFFLFLSSSAIVHILFLQKPDLGVTLFFFAFAYALLAWLTDGKDLRFLLIAGAFAGLSMGTKYTMMLFVMAAVAVALRETARGQRGRYVVPWREAALSGLVAAVFFAPWLWRNLAATGNPVYPLLNGLFGSPSWSPARMEVLSGDAHPLLAHLHGWKDLASLLGSLTFFPDTSMSGPGASIGVGILGTFLFPILVREPERGWRFLRNLSLALMMVWFLSSWISRYLLPALPFMALLTGFLGDRLAERFGRWGSGIAVLLLVAAVAAQGGSTIRQSPIHKAWAASFSLAGQPERGLRIASRFHPSLEAAAFVNARLPESAKILFLGETRVYYFQRTVVAPSPYDEHPIAKLAAAGPDPGTVRDRLAGQGYTHILVCWPEWERLGRQYYSRLWEHGEIEAADHFVRTLPAVYSDRRVTVFSLERRATETLPRRGPMIDPAVR